MNVIPANAGIQVFGENPEGTRVLESKPFLEMNRLST